MRFAPILVGGHYPGITRGLTADVLATQALSGVPYSICTTHVVAGRGVVTDILNVPADTVSAQLEHIFETESPTAAKVGIVGDAPSVRRIFEPFQEFDGPVVFDLTVSGPSGEDVLGQRALEVAMDQLSVPDLVTVRQTDAALVAGMEIPSLDDAQVAAQRIAQQGAERVLLRCGRLPTHHYETDSDPPDYALDLYFDGEDFALFEAPYLPNVDTVHGASSGLLLPVLRSLQSEDPVEEALQHAKARVSEALRAANEDDQDRAVSFFRALENDPTVAEA